MQSAFIEINNFENSGYDFTRNVCFLVLKTAQAVPAAALNSPHAIAVRNASSNPNLITTPISYLVFANIYLKEVFSFFFLSDCVKTVMKSTNVISVNSALFIFLIISGNVVTGFKPFFVTRYKERIVSSSCFTTYFLRTLIMRRK
jgi:hypothetical protein